MFRVLVFRVLVFRVFVFRVLVFRVLVFRVLDLRCTVRIYGLGVEIQGLYLLGLGRRAYFCLGRGWGRGSWIEGVLKSTD